MKQQEISTRAITIIAAIFGLLVMWAATSSCEFFRKLDKSEVKNENKEQEKESSFHKDSTGSKLDKSYTKETFIPVFQPRDTNVFNFNLPTNKATSPQYVYIKETGQENSQQSQVVVDTGWRDMMRTMISLQSDKKTETESSVLGTRVIIGLCVFAFILLVLVGVILYVVNKIKK
jgi:hypothetical protein